jgi:hypothetical protein
MLLHDKVTAVNQTHKRVRLNVAEHACCIPAASMKVPRT